MQYFSPRFVRHAGIAIGPILFVVALLAVIAGAMTSGFGTFGTNATIDRIRTEVRGQANLIRAKVQECYMITMGNPGADYPVGNAPAGVLVKNLDCPGDLGTEKNLWSGARPSSLPPTPSGFGDWVYFNYAGGRCLLIVPNSNARTAESVQAGLLAVSKNFNTSEAYLDSGASWSFSLWLTPKTTPGVCGA